MGWTPATIDAARLAELRRLQSEFGRVWQALRRRATRPCAVCGALMEDVVGNRRYCSVACQSKAYRRRHPEYAARRRARRQGTEIARTLRMQ